MSVVVVNFSKVFSSWHKWVDLNHIWYECLYGILKETDVGILDRSKSWPLLLKIDHRAKQQFFVNIMKTVQFSQILKEGKSVQHDEIYPWPNFHENLFTGCKSYCPFLRFFATFILLLVLFLKIFSWETTRQNVTKLVIYKYSLGYRSMHRTYVLNKQIALSDKDLIQEYVLTHCTKLHTNSVFVLQEMFFMVKPLWDSRCPAPHTLSSHTMVQVLGGWIYVHNVYLLIPPRTQNYLKNSK